VRSACHCARPSRAGPNRASVVQREHEVDRHRIAEKPCPGDAPRPLGDGGSRASSRTGGRDRRPCSRGAVRPRAPSAGGHPEVTRSPRGAAGTSRCRLPPAHPTPYAVREVRWLEGRRDAGRLG
jgi:hypothetical protein